MRPDCDEDGVEMLVQRVERECRTHRLAGHEVDADAPQGIQLLRQDVARQPIGRDAERQHAAADAGGFEDRDAAAGAAQIIGAGDPRRPGAHDRDPFRPRGPGLALDGGAGVGGKPLQGVDGQGLAADAERASGFAGAVANAAAHRRQRHAALEDGIFAAPLGDGRDEARDVVSERAGVGTRGAGTGQTPRRLGGRLLGRQAEIDFGERSGPFRRLDGLHFLAGRHSTYPCRDCEALTMPHFSGPRKKTLFDPKFSDETRTGGYILEKRCSRQPAAKRRGA